MRIRQRETVYEEIFEGPMPEFNPKLVYFGNVRHKPGHAIAPHIHGYAEICLLVVGTADYAADDRAYHLGVGDVCVTKPGELHTMAGTGESEWEVLYVAVESLGIPELDATLRHAGRQVVTGCTDLIPTFAKAVREAGQTRPGNLCMAHLLMNAWLIELVNRLGHSELTVRTICRSRVVEEARDYIERNAHHRLSLSEVADAVGLSKSRLAHRFSEEMEMPVYTYVRRILMQRALRLLEDDKMNISEIADLLGFPSIYCFSASFKRFWNFSPSEYRGRLNRNRMVPKETAGDGDVGPQTTDHRLQP